MYVKLHGEFQENKLSRETSSLTARKQCRNQPARRNASSNDSFPGYDQNFKNTEGCEKVEQGPIGPWGDSEVCEGKNWTSDPQSAGVVDLGILEYKLAA
jgi:hypothetical protein